MRQTWRGDPPRERRLDGKSYALEPFFFFAVAPDGHVYRGNARRVHPSPAEPEAGAGLPSERLTAVFHAFEEQVRAHASARPGDPEVEARLRALGYAP
jgi:hypothetical protein